jgi:endonuclease/exonuclease/phosphatase family metal-dependent hydrolase
VLYKYIKDKRLWALIIAIILISFAFGCDRDRGWSSAQVQFAGSGQTRQTDGVVPKASSPDERIITYWNACNFGNSKSEQTIDTMAEITRNSHILVILEVSTSEAGARAVAKLADSLNRKGSKWDYIVSETSSGNGSERVGILWQPAMATAKRKSARLLSDVESDIDREPFLIDFDIDGVTLTVGGFHAVPTAKKPEREFATLSSSRMMQENERFIFGGDFNLSAKKVAPHLAKLGLRTYIEEKTSLGTKLHKDGTYLASEYDHVCTRGVEVVQTGVASQLAFLGNDISRAREVSDHLPVYAIVRYR